MRSRVVCTQADMCMQRGGCDDSRSNGQTHAKVVQWYRRGSGQLDVSSEWLGPGLGVDVLQPRELVHEHLILLPLCALLDVVLVLVHRHESPGQFMCVTSEHKE